MERRDRLETESILRLLASLALPAICAQIITLVYSMADRIYVGRMDDGASLAAISLGGRDHGSAEKYIGNSFAMLAASSVAIIAAALALGDQLLRLFSASEAMLPYALYHLNIYVLGTVFIQFTVGPTLSLRALPARRWSQLCWAVS